MPTQGWGLGKEQSRLGKWIRKKGYTQEDLIRVSGVSRNTVSRLCSDEGYFPSGKTMQKIIKALREVDPSVRADMFWDL